MAYQMKYDWYAVLGWDLFASRPQTRYEPASSVCFKLRPHHKASFCCYEVNAMSTPDIGPLALVQVLERHTKTLALQRSQETISPEQIVSSGPVNHGGSPAQSYSILLLALGKVSASVLCSYGWICYCSLCRTAC